MFPVSVSMNLQYLPLQTLSINNIHRDRTIKQNASFYQPNFCIVLKLNVLVTTLQISCKILAKIIKCSPFRLDSRCWSGNHPHKTGCCSQDPGHRSDQRDSCCLTWNVIGWPTVQGFWLVDILPAAWSTNILLAIFSSQTMGIVETDFDTHTSVQNL